MEAYKMWGYGDLKILVTNINSLTLIICNNDPSK